MSRRITVTNRESAWENVGDERHGAARHGLPPRLSRHLLEVTVEDGRLVAIDAVTANPLTQGFICAKVKHHARRVYAPERVLTPLVRVGAKGAGDFRSATWDEALDLSLSWVSAAIAEDGPSSVVPYLYNSSAGSLAAEGLTWRMFDEIGAARVLHTICAANCGRGLGARRSEGCSRPIRWTWCTASS